MNDRFSAWLTPMNSAGGGPQTRARAPGAGPGATPRRGARAALVAFIAVTFLAPLWTMFARSVYDPVVADALPETLALLEEWDGRGLPDERVFATAARELARGGRRAALRNARRPR